MIFMLYRKILIKFCLYESLLSGADGGMIWFVLSTYIVIIIIVVVVVVIVYVIVNTFQELVAI